MILGRKILLICVFLLASCTVSETQAGPAHQVNADRFDEYGVTCFWIDRIAGRWDGGNAVAIDCIKDTSK